MPIPYGNIGNLPITGIKDKDLQSAFQLNEASGLLLSADVMLNRLNLVSEDDLKLALYCASERYKYPGSRVRFPFLLTSQERHFIYAKADVWIAKLQLCIHLHSYEEWGSPYRNAPEWFAKLIREIRFHKSQAVLERKLKRGKQNLADIIQEDINKLKRSENPEDPDESPHHWGVLQGGLEIQKCNERFKRQVWKPYLKTLVAYKNEIKENSAAQSVYFDGDKVFVQTGRGKQSKIFFKARSLERPQDKRFQS